VHKSEAGERFRLIEPYANQLQKLNEHLGRASGFGFTGDTLLCRDKDGNNKVIVAAKNKVRAGFLRRNLSHALASVAKSFCCVHPGWLFVLVMSTENIEGW
jgi:hypothetical protein